LADVRPAEEGPAADAARVEAARRPTAPSARTGLGRRLLGNYAYQLLNQAIRIGEQILLVPLFLTAWGADLYRDWLVIYAIVAFVGLCNFGTEHYFGNLFLRHAARGEHERVNRQVAIGVFCALVIGIALTASVSAGVFALDLRSLLHVGRLDGANDAEKLLLLMILPMSVFIAEQVLKTLYRAYDEFNRGECAFALYNALQIGSVAVALLLRQPPWVVALAYLVVPFVFSAGLVIDLVSRYPMLRLRVAVPTISELRELTPTSLLYFTFPLSLALVQHGTVLLLGALGVGATVVISYTVYRTFTGLARQAANQFAVGGGIEMARHLARGDLATCARLYDDTGRIVAALVGVLAGISIPISAPFISIWTRGVVEPDRVLLGMFLIGIYLAAPGQAAVTLLRYTNDARPCAAAWSFQAFGGLLLCAALVPAFGVAGAAAAFTVTEFLAFTVYLQLVVQQKFGFSAWRHWLRSFSAGAIAFVVSLAVAAFMIPRGRGVGIAELAAWSMVWAVVVIPPVFLVAINPAQRASLLGKTRRRLRSASALIL